MKSFCIIYPNFSSNSLTTENMDISKSKDHSSLYRCRSQINLAVLTKDNFLLKMSSPIRKKECFVIYSRILK